MITRLSKAGLVMLIGLYCLLAGVSNVFDYGSNLAFVQHVMSMDTTFPDNNLMGRAVLNPSAHHVAYWLIIVGEGLAGLLCIWGAWKIFEARAASKRDFAKAKQVAVLGLTLSAFLWLFGFLIVGAEWFLMWQSEQWNGIQSAFRFLMCTGIVLIYLTQQDEDIVR